METPQRPPLQGNIAQQSALVVHCWPYWAHAGPASGGGGTTTVPASGVPPEVVVVGVPPAGPQGPQTPVALPGASTQAVPGQQSALLVHPPHAATQAFAEQTKGGIPPATGLGTQGAVLQQSALEAQAPPGFTHIAGEHRGTPTLS
jgi:hypothetical protein